MTNETLGAGRQAVSVEVAAIQLGVGRSLAWSLVRDKKLRSVKAGHRVLVPLSAIEDFLADNSQDALEENKKTAE